MVTDHVGVVTTWDAGTRLAQLAGLPGLIPVMRHVSLAVNDVAVAMMAAGRFWVVGVLGESAPVGPPPEGTPEPGQMVIVPGSAPASSGSTPLRPTWSGSWRAGSWRPDTSDLYQGDYTGRGVQSGACWWGALPDDLSAAKLRLERLDGAGSGAALAPTLTLLAGTSRPAGAATVLDSVAGPALERGKGADWTVPAGWLAQLNAKTAGGIGITSGGSASPYLGLSASGVGMTLTVTHPE